MDDKVKVTKPNEKAEKVSTWTENWSKRFDGIRENPSLIKSVGSGVDYFRDTVRLKGEYTGKRLYLGRRIDNSLYTLFIAEDKGKSPSGELLIGKVTEVIFKEALSEVAYREYKSIRDRVNGKPSSPRGGAAIALRKSLAGIAEETPKPLKAEKSNGRKN